MLGRVVEAIYVLKYLNEEDLRQRDQLQLNRGEHRHRLARCIFFADQGEFRTGITRRSVPTTGQRTRLHWARWSESDC